MMSEVPWLIVGWTRKGRLLLGARYFWEIWSKLLDDILGIVVFIWRALMLLVVGMVVILVP